MSLSEKIECLETQIKDLKKAGEALSNRVYELEQFVGISTNENTQTEEKKKKDYEPDKSGSPKKAMKPKFDFWTIRSGGGAWFQGFIKSKPRWTKHAKAAKKYKTWESADNDSCTISSIVGDCDHQQINGYGNEV